MAKHEINVPELIGKVYFEVAEWHNGVGDDAEENKTALYGKSFKIINLILSEVGLNMGEELNQGAPDPDKGIPEDPEDDRLAKMEKQLKALMEKLTTQNPETS